MRAADLDHAIELQNTPAYGLTAGLQALDPVEIEHWRGRAEAGNLYVNRTITGAIVGRQPFGGWKRSVVGPGAKAGGPNYVASLGRRPTGESGPASYRRAWQEMARPSDPTGLRAEANVFRYRPLRRVALIGTERSGSARAAASAAGVEVVEVDDPSQMPGGGFDKLRILAPASDALLRAAHASGVWVDTAPVAADPRAELLRWVREQAVSESRHRHGHVTGRRPGLLPPPG
jgi:RHH-type proline utilization regulon transcriptional repressor/proline dehydrogenase/delta 1-pyrroline-5-carboxylate dehydrogenase